MLGLGPSRAVFSTKRLGHTRVRGQMPYGCRLGCAPSRDDAALPSARRSPPTDASVSPMTGRDATIFSRAASAWVDSSGVCGNH